MSQQDEPPQDAVELIIEPIYRLYPCEGIDPTLYRRPGRIITLDGPLDAVITPLSSEP